jgi:Leucine-rich repeat (LRR) protein
LNNFRPDNEFVCSYQVLVSQTYQFFSSDINEPGKVKNVEIDFTPFSKILNGIGQHFPNLEKLTIRGIKFTHKENFEHLNKLKQLILSENQNLRLFDNSFLHLKNLENLDLSDCKIENLPENIFEKQRKLKLLDLGENLLTSLDVGLFENNIKLEIIRLSFNNLQTIRVNFTKLPKLKTLRFSVNDKICNKSFDNREITFLSRSPSIHQFQTKINQKCFRNPTALKRFRTQTTNQ